MAKPPSRSEPWGPLDFGAFASSPDGFCVLKPLRDSGGAILDFTWEYANPVAEGMARVGPLQGRRLLDGCAGFPADMLFEQGVRVLESGRAEQTEMVCTQEGSPCPLQCVAMKLEDGVAFYLRGAAESVPFKKALYDSEARFRTLVENIPGIAYSAVFDGSLRMTYVSPQIECFTGLRPEEWLARPDAWGQQVHPEDRDFVGRTGMEAARRGDPIRLDYRIVLPDGSVRWMHDQAIPVPGNGEAVHYQGLAVDVSALRSAEAVAQSSEAEFRAMFELAACGHVQVDPYSGRYIRVNRRFCEMTGYTAEELLGMTFMDLTHPEDRGYDLRIYYKALEGETREWSLEKRYIRKDGRVIWVFLTGALLRDAQGRPVRTNAIVLDITAEKAALEALRGGEERLRLILEQVPCLLWTTDDRLSITSVSGGHSIRGGNGSELPGDVLHERLEDVLCEHVTAHLRALLGEVVEYEATLDGLTDMTVAVRVEPLHNVDGQTVGTIATGLDVSGHARAEQELRGLAQALEQRVAERTSELTRSYEALRQSERLAAIGEMVTALSHESRNDIQNGLYAIEMLRRLAETPEQKCYAERALQAIEHLRKTYEGVRDYAAPINLERAVAPLDGLWREAWEELASVRKGRDARLIESCEGVDLHCLVDAFRVKQVFRNLFENALAACPDPVEIMVACDEGALDGRPALHVRVRDNGPGLSDAEPTRIFDAFFTTKAKGTGLGLSIIRRIIETHGGHVEANQPEGCGLELVILLPRGSGGEE